MYAKYTPGEARYYMICERYGKRTKLVLAALFTYYVLLIGLYHVAVITYFMQTGILEPCMGMKLPAAWGEAMMIRASTIALNYVLSFYDAFGAVALDAIMILVFVNMSFLAELNVMSIQVFNDELVSPANNDQAIIRWFRKIIDEQIEFNE